MVRSYKIMAEIDKVTWYVDPIIKAARVGHRERLYKEAKLKSVQKTSFLSNKVVNPWNKLDDATVQASSSNRFKNRVNADHNGYFSSVEI